MKLVYTQYLKYRLKIRKFSHDYPRRIIYRPDLKFHDTKTNSLIAIRRLPYSGEIRYITLAYIYEYKNKSVKIFTIHVESKKEIANRVKNRRYILR